MHNLCICLIFIRTHIASYCTSLFLSYPIFFSYLSACIFFPFINHIQTLTLYLAKPSIKHSTDRYIKAQSDQSKLMHACMPAFQYSVSSTHRKLRYAKRCWDGIRFIIHATRPSYTSPIEGKRIGCVRVSKHNRNINVK